MKRNHLYATHRAIRRETPQQLRSDWRALLTGARDLAAPTAWHPGQRPERRGASIEQRLLDFRHLLRETRPEQFPIDGASIALMTEGFLKVGRAFVEAGSPELREILGTPLAACAEALTDILDGARDAAAAAFNRRVMGDRED